MRVRCDGCDEILPYGGECRCRHVGARQKPKLVDPLPNTASGKADDVPRVVRQNRKPKDVQSQQAEVSPPSRSRGRPRLEEMGETIEAKKPWLAMTPVMSRASWYRRGLNRRNERLPP